MNPSFIFYPDMTHTFLSYAEKTNVSNQKVLLLIDNLRRGLSEEDLLKKQAKYIKWNFQKQKNLLTCQCIMIRIQCLANLSAKGNLYGHFINDWNLIAASC